MSISPVFTIPSELGTQSQPAQPRPATEPAAAPGKSSQPDSGNSQQQENQHLPASAQPLELPEDEVQVQVQRDAETNGEVVIKYLDHSGNVILQVPSSQVLGLTRSIEQGFEQEAKTRADANRQTSREGGTSHGN